jgi:hypothetical protein
MVKGARRTRNPAQNYERILPSVKTQALKVIRDGLQAAQFLMVLYYFSALIS